MKATIQKWGNSLALRIPKALADEIHVKEKSGFELSINKAGALVLMPDAPKSKRLEDLLAKVNPQNLHQETDWGGPVGKELW